MTDDGSRDEPPVRAGFDSWLGERLRDPQWAAGYHAGRERLARTETALLRRENQALRMAMWRIVGAAQRSATEAAKSRNPSWEAQIRDSIAVGERILAEVFPHGDDDIRPDPSVPPTPEEWAGLPEGFVDESGDLSSERRAIDADPVRRARHAAFLAELEARFGPIPPEVQAAVDAIPWPDAPSAADAGSHDEPGGQDG